MWKTKLFLKRICRLLEWLPVIWRDQDWDHDFLFIIMEHKLKRMLAFWQSDQHYTMPDRAMKIQRQIMETIGLLERARNEREPCAKQLEDSFDDKWIDSKMEDKRWKPWLKTQQKQSDQDWERLWTIMRKYSKGWWD